MASDIAMKIIVNGFSSLENNTKKIIHIEILQKSQSTATQEDLKEKVIYHLAKEKHVTTEVVLRDQELPEGLRPHLTSIHITKDTDSASDHKYVELSNAELQCHVYRLEQSGPDTEELPGTDDEHEVVPAATQWLLPSSDFHNLWDSLIYDTDVKDKLLHFVSTALLFSDCGVDPSIISWNRVVLLHGPPGTGKTSLCRALAHKLSIRLGHRYTYGQLIEINSHSLFSKWFSESGKLVQKLFSRLHELVEDRNALVFVLIDEVESLARSRCSSSSEPGDAIRVVNALLTQLDQIKRHPNVLILTTSNISGSVDLAFVDRADIKHYIGLPSQAAIYQIYVSCVVELAKVGLISHYEREPLLTLRQLRIASSGPENDIAGPSRLLWEVAGRSTGLSGRSLRKLPFLAHALHLRRSPHSLVEFISALDASVEQHKKDNELLAQQPGTV